MIFLFQFCISIRLTELTPFLGPANITLTSQTQTKGQFNTSPLFSGLPRFDRSSFSIYKMRFSNIAFSVYRGFANNLTITSCKFQNSISPIYLSMGDTSKLKPVNTREEYNRQALTLRDTIFDFCSSLSENGGSVFADSCEISFNGVEFIHSIAQNGGALYIIQGHAKLESCSFFKCSAKKNSGAFFSKECGVNIKKTYFVQNSAGHYAGAISHTTGVLNMVDCYLYENQATKGYAGITTDETSGELIKLKFRDNKSPTSEGGTSLYVGSTPLDFFVEECVFNGDVSQIYNYIKFHSDSIIHVTDSCFDVVESHTHTIKGDPLPEKVSIEKKPYWGNNNYLGQCPPAPKLPSRYYKELFHYPKSAPQIEWWRLYLALGMFAFLVIFMAFAIPAVFFPLIAEGATRRGESKNETKL